MAIDQGRRCRSVRALFVSDIHLGCRHARTREFLDFLNRYEPEQLYLIGDFIDGWKLRRKLDWRPEFNDILSRLYELHEHGTQIFYTPGNHDDFLRQFRWNFGFVSIEDEFVHQTADGQRFLVTHGDKFDRVEAAAKWVSVMASLGYDVLLSANRLFSRWRRTTPGSEYSLGSTIKRRVKAFVRYISDFESRLAGHARERNCEGVICGHIHTPARADLGGVVYCNTGDWVENCTAFVEDYAGELRLIRYFDDHRAVSAPATDDCHTVITRAAVPKRTLPRRTTAPAEAVAAAGKP
ncbi:MAG: UDP-2,3-diacylglucosamine diphosphatase [Planctomycetaceae bacterium]|nr:UDP-2,3-diacylglucosamine diphosphatase [Planctomycetaceae bacterium]